MAAAFEALEAARSVESDDDVRKVVEEALADLRSRP